MPADSYPMKCERCGERAALRRDDEALCSRCALRADWEGMALAVQGSAVIEAAVTAQKTGAGAPAAPDRPVASPGPNLPPADPFAS